MVASVWTLRRDASTSCPVLLGALVGMPAGDLDGAAARARAAGRAARAARRRVRRRGRRGRVGRRPLPARRRDVLLLFCAVAIGGWSMLAAGLGAAPRLDRGRRRARPSSAPPRPRRTLSLESLRTTLAYHEDFHKGLAAALADPARARAARAAARCCRCPNNKLIPDARWILDTVGQHDIVARSQARADVGQGLAHARGPHPPRQRRGLPARQRGVRRGDRRRRRRPARPGPAEGLQTHLHEPLLRGLCATAESRTPARRAPRRRGVRRRGRRAWAGGSRWCSAAASRCGCGACARGCRTPTTPTRPTTSCRTRCGCSNEGTLNPHYFANPPAFTYLLHFLFALCLRRRGSGGARLAPRTRPSSTRSRASPPRCSARSRCGCSTRPARACSAAAWACWPRRSRRSRSCPSSTRTSRSTTCPTLAPLTLSLLGSAGVLRDGRAARPRPRRGRARARLRDQVHGRDRAPALARGRSRARYLRGRARAPAARRWAESRSRAPARSAAFLIANPYALLDYSAFHGELVHQSTLSAEAQGKLGAPRAGRARLLPVVAHLGARLGARRWRRSAARWRCGAASAALGWVLVPAPRRCSCAFMGLAGPLLRPLAAADLPDPLPARGVLRRACVALAAGDRPRGRGAGWRQRAPAAAPRAAGRGRRACAAGARRSSACRSSAALLAQGLVYSVHSGLVLSRADTRNAHAAWMLAHIPAGHADRRRAGRARPWAAETPGAPRGTRNAGASTRSLFRASHPDGALRVRPRARGGHRELRAHARPRR